MHNKSSFQRSRKIQQVLSIGVGYILRTQIMPSYFFSEMAMAVT